jgi:NAD(P)-dependent dehydrogenase (short-subunit alcohol dehydrogenase family)
MATPFGKTADGFETQFGTNHIGHFLLFQLLKPTLLKSATPEFPSRVVSVSSIGHRGGEIRFHDFNFSEPNSYSPWAGYGQAKTANIYLANEIERRYGSQNLHATSLHPGGISTGLQVHVMDTMKQWAGDKEIIRGMKSVEQGAATSVYAALSKEWESKGGKYLSDCEEMGPVVEWDMTKGDAGYADWAYDEEKSKKLWVESLKMVGLADDS